MLLADWKLFQHRCPTTAFAFTPVSPLASRRSFARRPSVAHFTSATTRIRQIPPNSTYGMVVYLSKVCQTAVLAGEVQYICTISRGDTLIPFCPSSFVGILHTFQNFHHSVTTIRGCMFEIVSCYEDDPSVTRQQYHLN